ncbi:MAG TPA: ABC-2 family transporter protein [Clostridia bacterium]|nr:ABC-2 family transporter protein [Clostridia bacterium]
MIQKTASKYFAITRAVAFATYKEWAAYRTHAMVSILVGPTYFLVQSFIWRSVLAAGSIGGFTLNQMLTYFGITALLHYLTMDFADWNLQMLIHTGKFLTFALRPVSHIYFALSQKLGHRILGFLFEFLPVYLIFLFVFKINLFPARPFWSLLSLILGFLMVFFVNYSLGVTAFWLIKTSGIRRVFLLLRDICSGALFPLMLFPPILQKALFILPFQFMSYVPARVFIGSYELAGLTLSIPAIVGLQAAATFIMGIATVFFARAGMRRFTGVGV